MARPKSESPLSERALPATNGSAGERQAPASNQWPDAGRASPAPQPPRTSFLTVLLRALSAWVV